MNGKARAPQESRETGPLVQDQGDHFRNVSTKRTGGQEPGAPGDAPDSGAVDRDAMGQADYGGTREAVTEAETQQSGQQGGLSVDDASGGGRKPTAERDRDYDPDGAGTRR